MKKALFPTANEFYRATLSDGIDGFFKLYRPAFAAQEIHITADYPTFFGLPEKDGVEFMEDYLRCLSHENRFLGCFAPETVHALLLGLDERYPQLILNLYGPVLAAALGCVLTRQSVARLRYDPAPAERPAGGKVPAGDEKTASSGGGGLYPGRRLPRGAGRLSAPQRAAPSGGNGPCCGAGPSGGGGACPGGMVNPLAFSARNGYNSGSNRMH